jgi:hypothetical protein
MNLHDKLSLSLWKKTIARTANRCIFLLIFTMLLPALTQLVGGKDVAVHHETAGQVSQERDTQQRSDGRPRAVFSGRIRIGACSGVRSGLRRNAGRVWFCHRPIERSLAAWPTTQELLLPAVTCTL